MTKEYLRQGQEFDLEDILQNQSGQARVETTPGKYINISVASDAIWIQAENTPFFFRAEVRNGVLRTNIQLKGSSGERDEDMPSGKEFVRIGMDFFKANNIDITKFVATWNENEDNFNQFLRNRNLLNMNENDAAWNTWTGQNIAQAYGFTQIDGVFADMHSANRFVVVNFSRPTAQTNP